MSDDFRGCPRLLPLAPPLPVPADFLDEPVIVTGSAPFCDIVLPFEDQGDPGLKLKSEPAAVMKPFLIVFMTAKFWLPMFCASLPLYLDVGAVRSESMLLSGLDGFLGLPEPEARMLLLSAFRKGVDCRDGFDPIDGGRDCNDAAACGHF